MVEERVGAGSKRAVGLAYTALTEPNSVLTMAFFSNSSMRCRLLDLPGRVVLVFDMTRGGGASDALRSSLAAADVIQRRLEE